MQQKVLEANNEVRANKGFPAITEVDLETSLQTDLKMDSLDLAELAARIENKTGIDVFSEGIASTVGAILSKLS